MKRIRLSRGKSVIVDDADYESLRALSWFAYRKSTGEQWEAIHSFSYTPTPGKEGCWRVRMVHLLMGRTPAGMVIDHKNGNTLDNRRSNLRFATYSQNSRNKKHRCDSRSPFKGLTLRLNGKYTAVIGVGGRNISLGTFERAEDAAMAYNEAAIQRFGAFARLNKIPDMEEVAA